MISGQRARAEDVTTVGFLSTGTSGDEPFIKELEREVVRVRGVDLSAVEGDSGPGGTVTLCWLPCDCDWQVLTDIVSWRARAGHGTGLIGLVARGDVSDRETGLAAGFDDIVVGPLSAKEVAARVRALARRLGMATIPATNKLSFGSLVIDPERDELRIDGQQLAVTRTEMAVLTELVRAQGSTRSRADILAAAWGQQAVGVGERAVDNVVLRLRRKLRRPGLIVTVRGVGFRLAD